MLSSWKDNMHLIHGGTALGISYVSEETASENIGEEEKQLYENSRVFFKKIT